MNLLPTGPSLFMSCINMLSASTTFLDEKVVHHFQNSLVTYNMPYFHPAMTQILAGGETSSLGTFTLHISASYQYIYVWVCSQDEPSYPLYICASDSCNALTPQNLLLFLLTSPPCIAGRLKVSKRVAQSKNIAIFLQEIAYLD